jgi:hypothetical protein
MKKSDNDKMILELKKQVESKKKLLKSSERFSPKTNCNLTLHNERYNLNVVDKPTLLLLLAQLQSLNTSVKQVLPDETLEISGFSADLWIDDIKSKYSVLNRKLENERLNVLELKLHALLSIDKKVELEIADLKSQI